MPSCFIVYNRLFTPYRGMLQYSIPDDFWCYMANIALIFAMILPCKVFLSTCIYIISIFVCICMMLVYANIATACHIIDE